MRTVPRGSGHLKDSISDCGFHPSQDGLCNLLWRDMKTLAIVSFLGMHHQKLVHDPVCNEREVLLIALLGHIIQLHSSLSSELRAYALCPVYAVTLCNANGRHLGTWAPSQAYWLV